MPDDSRSAQSGQAKSQVAVTAATGPSRTQAASPERRYRPAPSCPAGLPRRLFRRKRHGAGELEEFVLRRHAAADRAAVPGHHDVGGFLGYCAFELQRKMLRQRLGGNVERDRDRLLRHPLRAKDLHLLAEVIGRHVFRPSPPRFVVVMVAIPVGDEKNLCVLGPPVRKQAHLGTFAPPTGASSPPVPACACCGRARRRGPAGCRRPRTGPRRHGAARRGRPPSPCRTGARTSDR